MLSILQSWSNLWFSEIPQGVFVLSYSHDTSTRLLYMTFVVSPDKRLCSEQIGTDRNRHRNGTEHPFKFQNKTLGAVGGSTATTMSEI